MKPSLRVSALIPLLLISLVLSACIPLETPTTPDPVEASATAQPPTAYPVEPSPEVTQPVQEPETLIFKNSTFFDYMPFEMRYYADEWQLGSDGIASTTIDKCNLRGLLGRGAGPSDGPFDLQAGDNLFYYLVERPQTTSPDPTITYFIYLKPSQPEFQSEDLLWAFEMLTSPESEEACFQAINPVLATLTISMPKNKLADKTLVWDDSLSQQYCDFEIEGRVHTIAFRDEQLVMSGGLDLDQLYLIDLASRTKTPLLQSAFPGGVIQSPIQVDGDYLIFLDSENYMLTQRWNISAYNFLTHETRVLIDGDQYPTTSAMFVHFDIEGGPLYVTIVESPADVGMDRSSILKVDPTSGASEEIFVLESEHVRLGRLSVNSATLLVEQQRVSKEADINQELILIKFEPNNIVQDSFGYLGSNPMLSESLAVWAIQPSESFPESVSIYDFSTQDLRTLDLLGDMSILQYLTTDYLSWQSWGGPSAPTLGVYFASLARDEITNIVSQGDETALTLPIVIGDSLLFSITSGYGSMQEKSQICSLPLEEIEQMVQTEQSDHPTDTVEMTLELIPLVQSGLLGDPLQLKAVPVDPALEPRMSPTLKELGGYYTSNSVQPGQPLGSEDYFAQEITQESPTQGPVTGLVTVHNGDQEVFRIATGPIGAASSITDFFITDGGSYALEVVENRPAGGDQESAERISHVIVDGISLNHVFAADEVFNYRLVDGKEFMFIRHGDQLSYVYNGGEAIPLPFDKIYHNLCCGYALWNPTNYDNAITFYAAQGEQEYYVILSKPGS